MLRYPPRVDAVSAVGRERAGDAVAAAILVGQTERRRIWRGAFKGVWRRGPRSAKAAGGVGICEFGQTNGEKIFISLSK